MPEACILVVDDEPLVRDLIACELRDAGFVVIEAASGVEALERIASPAVIDLLFTDIVLGPGPDGWDVAIAFREAGPGRPVIYASAYVPGAHRRVLGSVFFDKPYLPLQIVHAARLLLANRVPAAPEIEARTAPTTEAVITLPAPQESGPADA
jgi:CheY-like chemotaxis protein